MKRLHVHVAVEDLAHSIGFYRTRPVLEQGATSCCYARSQKAWITDPQGLSWETFLTTGETTVYGDSAELGAIRIAAPAPCCAPDAGRADAGL